MGRGGCEAVGLLDLPVTRLLDALREAVVVVDESQRIVAMNPAALEILDVRLDDAIGGPLARFVPEPQRARHAGWVRDFATSGVAQRALAGGRTIRALRANGEPFPAQVTLSRLDVVDRTGPRQFLTALLRDLSVEQRLEQELAAQQRRTRAVFELAPIALWIAEGERVIFANRAAARLFGATEGEALRGRALADLLDPESGALLRARVAQALDGQRDLAPLRAEFAAGDGMRRRVEIAVAALPDHGRTTVQMVVTDVTEREREGQELVRSRRSLRRMSARVEEAREEERRRIARELHDELGQRLTALKMELAGLAAASGLDADEPRVAAMQSTIDETVASLRRIAADLRPLMLDDLGLTAAIEWLAADASRRLGLRVDLEVPELDPPIDERMAIALYRMAQEALSNVARHSRGESVRIAVARGEAGIDLTVDDDGAGFPRDVLEREGSFGLLGIRERAELFGGTIELGRSAAGGARLAVHLPLRTATVPR